MSQKGKSQITVKYNRLQKSNILAVVSLLSKLLCRYKMIYRYITAELRYGTLTVSYPHKAFVKKRGKYITWYYH